MELRQHVLGDLVQRVGQRPLVAPQVQADVLHTRGAQRMEFPRQRVAARLRAEAKAPQRRVRVLGRSRWMKLA